MIRQAYEGNDKIMSFEKYCLVLGYSKIQN
jgi:hypothetical protein